MNMLILLGYRGMCASEYFVAGLTVPYRVRRLFSFTLDAHFVLLFLLLLLLLLLFATNYGIILNFLN